MNKDKLKKYKNRFRLILVYTNSHENKDYIQSKNYTKNILLNFIKDMLNL